jgi:polysaccharide export outer membrane protein
MNWIIVKAHPRFTLGLLLLALAAGLWAQKQEPVKEPVKAKENSPENLAEFAKSAAAPVDPKTYLIGPEDILLVRVWREPELSGPVAVRPDGQITLPLVGDLQAGGLSPEMLVEGITKKLSTLMNSPQVMVSVQAVRSKKYYIIGEVGRPGEYPLVTPTTVLDALSNAGGFREFANTKKIVIMRGDKRLKFNYKEVTGGKNLEQNIALENNDHIVVP